MNLEKIIRNTSKFLIPIITTITLFVIRELFPSLPDWIDYPFVLFGVLITLTISHKTFGKKYWYVSLIITIGSIFLLGYIALLTVCGMGNCI